MDKRIKVQHEVNNRKEELAFSFALFAQQMIEVIRVQTNVGQVPIKDI